MLFRLSKTQRITGNVFVVKTMISNFFIYSDNNTAVCFDTGFMPAIINRELKKINIDPCMISGIFLTYPDFSRTGGIKVFKNANIYFSQDTSSKRSQKLISYLNNKIKSDYKKLEDGEIVNIGKIKVRSFVIPDHPSGSMSYMVNDSILFI
ncbi:MBL fold metallo-hydrolase [Clostridium sp. LBM24168]